jgi:ribonucleotide monophosphatase NagD (HAD superfamily)
MAGLVHDLAGAGPHVMVGDRPDTDGRFATTLGVPFALVLSGVTTSADLPVTPEPTFVSTDLRSLVDDRLAAPA